MELGTFGAILTYALELEDEVTAFFTEAAEAVGEGQAGEAFSGLAKAGRKRLKALERTRRENVAEMILEPISDFDSEDYLCNATVSANTGAAGLVKEALELEGTAADYYATASEKVSVPEVARILKKMGEQHVRQQATLTSLNL